MVLFTTKDSAGLGHGLHPRSRIYPCLSSSLLYPSHHQPFLLPPPTPRGPQPPVSAPNRPPTVWQPPAQLLNPPPNRQQPLAHPVLKPPFSPSPPPSSATLGSPGTRQRRWRGRGAGARL